MTDVQFAEEIIQRLEKQNPRFHGKGYLFLLSALELVLSGLNERRHITGAELAIGVRDLAMREFGPMARTVLGHWGIHTTDDLGEIVFSMVECGVLVRQEDDKKEDFASLFDFEEVFERDYPWGRRL